MDPKSNTPEKDKEDTETNTSDRIPEDHEELTDEDEERGQENHWNDMLRVLGDKAVLSLLAPALLVFLGQARTTSFHARLGVPDTNALPALPTLMATGFSLLLEPVGFLAFLYIFIWAYFSVIRRKLLSPFRLSELPLMAWIALAAWMAAAGSVVTAEDDSPVLVSWLNFTFIDAIIVVFVASFGGIIFIVAHSRSKTAQVLVGRTLSGTIVLVFIIMGGLLLHASSQGVNAGSDIAFRCVDYPGIQLDLEDIDFDQNKTYIFIAHEGGFYYLRDPGLNGNNLTSVVVPDDRVRTITHTQVEATRSC